MDSFRKKDEPSAWTGMLFTIHHVNGKRQRNCVENFSCFEFGHEKLIRFCCSVNNNSWISLSSQLMIVKAKPNEMMDAERQRVITQKRERNSTALIVSKIAFNWIWLWCIATATTHTHFNRLCFFGTMTITLRLKIGYMCKRWVDVESINTNPTHKFTPCKHQHEWCVFNTFNAAQCVHTCVGQCSGIFRITFAQLMCTERSMRQFQPKWNEIKLKCY